MFAGMDHEHIVGTGLSLLVVLASCALLGFCTTPAETAACGIAAVLGLIAFGLYLGGD